MKIARMFFCLLLVTWVVCGAEDVMVNNVVVVLDASGSMNSFMRGTTTVKMDAAKDALKEVLAQVPPDTHIGLLVFGGGDNKEWRFPLGPRDDNKIKAAIDRATPNGGTPLGRFIAMGTDALKDKRKKQLGYGTYRLLVVTDGQASDPEKVNVYAPSVISSGIRLDVIGVDMSGKHKLANWAHSYRSADDPQALKKAVADVFAEVGGADASVAASEAFTEIASIPAETAGAMIKALGEPVQAKAVVVKNTETKSNVSNAPANTQQGNSNVKIDGSDGIGWWKIILAVIAFIFLKSLFGKKSR